MVYLAKILSTVTGLTILGLITLSGCGPRRMDQAPSQPASSPQDQLIEANKQLLQLDVQKIRDYAAANDIDFQETKTGLFYTLLQKDTSGEVPDMISQGDTIVLDYRMFLMNGQIIYTSENRGPKEFVVGKGDVEQGLDEAVQLFSRGDRALLALLPHLAFGLVGDGERIPARTILLYDIQIRK